ncbi:MAG: hypothetical protein ACOY93_13505 [Bacillota bacterium]
MRLFTEEEKRKRVKREIGRLRKLFREMPKERQSAAEGLIQEAAFMRVTLEEARHIIDRDGVLETFEQGEQRFLREHPATKVYNAMIQRYSTVCKQMVDLLPDGDPKDKSSDALMEFLKKSRR